VSVKRLIFSGREGLSDILREAEMRRSDMCAFWEA